MKLLTPFFLFIIPFFISSCSPHPAAGKWKASNENTLGIEKLSILYEGKSEFISKEAKPITWHCFWAAQNKTHMSMTCTPSTNTEKHEQFEFAVISQDEGELTRQGKIIGLFHKQAYNAE